MEIPLVSVTTGWYFKRAINILDMNISQPTHLLIFDLGPQIFVNLMAVSECRHLNSSVSLSFTNSFLNLGTDGFLAAHIGCIQFDVFEAQMLADHYCTCCLADSWSISWFSSSELIWFFSLFRIWMEMTITIISTSKFTSSFRELFENLRNEHTRRAGEKHGLEGSTIDSSHVWGRFGWNSILLFDTYL